MAYIRVGVPDGEHCKNCRFQQNGTIVCTLFDVLLNEDDIGMIKCERCPRA